MEWYYILLIVIGAILVLMLILGTFAVCRAAGLADQRIEEGYAYRVPLYRQLEDVVYGERYKVSGIAMQVILAVSAKLKLDPNQDPIPLFREALKEYIATFDDMACQRYMLMRHVSQNEIDEAKSDDHLMCYTVAKRELNILLSGILHEEI
jgi:hypothetical protein